MATPIDPDRLNLAVEDARLDLAISFDPNLHPRNLKGQFRKILDGMSDGDVQTVKGRGREYAIEKIPGQHGGGFNVVDTTPGQPHGNSPVVENADLDGLAKALHNDEVDGVSLPREGSRGLDKALSDVFPRDGEQKTPEIHAKLMAYDAESLERLNKRVGQIMVGHEKHDHKVNNGEPGYMTRLMRDRQSAITQALLQQYHGHVPAHAKRDEAKTPSGANVPEPPDDGKPHTPLPAIPGGPKTISAHDQAVIDADTARRREEFLKKTSTPEAEQEHAMRIVAHAVGNYGYARDAKNSTPGVDVYRTGIDWDGEGHGYADSIEIVHNKDGTFNIQPQSEFLDEDGNRADSPEPGNAEPMFNVPASKMGESIRKLMEELDPEEMPGDNLGDPTEEDLEAMDLSQPINEDLLALAYEEEIESLQLGDCTMPHAALAKKGKKKCPSCGADLDKDGDSGKDTDGDGD